MPSHIIPCEDCAAARARFEERQFTVSGCVAVPERPGMCALSVEPPALDVAPLDGPASGRTVASQATSLSPTQAKTAQAIVDVFETGRVLGAYGQVTMLSGDPGRLSYGRSQATLGSGNLEKLLLQYTGNAGARFGRRLAPWIPLVSTHDERVDHDTKLHNLLRACADDPVMRDTQDAFFDENFWLPAVRAATNLGLKSPLAIAVVYDSHVHGSWKLIRDRTSSELGAPKSASERDWIARFVKLRGEWLATNKVVLLRNTVYRTDALQRLIDLGQWGLELPIVVRGAEISLAALNATPQECYDGPPPGARPLLLQEPLARGLDVRLLQLGLSDLGADIKADGVFGQASRECVRQLQIARGLPVNGVADIGLIGQVVT